VRKIDGSPSVPIPLSPVVGPSSYHTLYVTRKSEYFSPRIRPLDSLSTFSVCGILGLLLHDPSIDAATEISEGLALLQHRGQDACGIITCGPKGRFYQCKANGMVCDVFDANSLSPLIGGMGVGHGELIKFPPIHLNLTHAKSSSLPNCWHV